MSLRGSGMVYALLAARWVLALALFRAGVAKLGSRERLADAIGRYALVPARCIATLAAGLPNVEIVVGLALALGVVPDVTGWLASALLLGFAGAVAANLMRGRRFDCGCGGSLDGQISWPLVVRNLLLAGLAAAVALGPAGLAAAPSGHPVHIAPTTLLPVPMIVTAVFCSARCLQSYALSRRAVGRTRAEIAS
jgi:uncharacterized membrane protein YphA (DoxX/SURF4 family)